MFWENHGVRLDAKVECSGAYLSEGLRESNLVTFLDKVPNCVGILCGVPGCEALVGHIEEGEELTLLQSNISINFGNNGLK
jgi:hypothetical protein